MNIPRTQITRGQNRAVTDKSKVYEIIDESLICHVSFIRDNYPVVLPTNYARFHDKLVLHGSYHSPFHKAIANAETICISIALIDSLVLGKSAYNHSVNYRSVVIYGKAAEVTDREEKREMLKTLIDHVIKNRWDKLRPPSESELDTTMVLTVPIAEYSAKSREGDPTVASGDTEIPVWSGILPLSSDGGIPLGDKYSKNFIPDKDITEYSRKSYHK